MRGWDSVGVGPQFRLVRPGTKHENDFITLPPTNPYLSIVASTPNN